MAVTLNANTSTGFIATSDTSGVLQLQTAGTTAVTIDTSQNVGIGTSSPNRKLEVLSAGEIIRATSTTGANDQLISVKNDSGTANCSTNIFFADRYAASSYASSYIRGTTSGTSALIFATGGTNFTNIYDAGAPTERMRIDSSGNVGIGTTSPVNNGGGYQTLTLNGTNAGILQIQVNGSTAGQIFSRSSTNLTINSPSTNIVFETGNTERMRIDSNGVLCVNGTSASGSISVKERGIQPTTAGLGSAAISVYGSYGGGIAMFDSSTASGSGYLLWVDDGSNDFNIARGTSSSAVTGGVYINNNAGSWSARSDERDKINLEPINNAINKVTQLRAVIGEYVWAEGVRHPFLIAQDVQAVLPEAVSIANKSQPEEDQRFGVSYTDVIPLLVAAIKEQQALIQQLQADVAALKGTS